MQEDTIFDKIIRKELPSTPIYEDELCYCFKDINPQAPIHYVLVPKNRDGLTQLSKAEDKHKDLLGHLMVAVSKIANQEPQLKKGYRLIINDGEYGGQTVFHLHIHIIGGVQLSWQTGAPQNC
ncbi:hypothetical protein IMG5_142840 [Ichthyophthirius multifiliis]|uniref:HIT domain-containing protein n=1 Tax=Ichthyophthirius multifiliis TaxID=5932 RepID=G0QXH3_ICHMU|nr:hypothetical protein IMG5_142840 [Ichthyophthirius multifiliis]EGR30091.1 hypothetical protein IMG5_142840 [Ichthyophthirius multifiliis]|eukprot:XP_004031327.1 hypothetical protein IMG5_142840 [Ichthyophthirius multifiliis]